jgi:UDP-N-acetylmuramyl pentapeptide synthase
MTEWTLDQIIAWTKASIYPAVLSLPDFCVSRISCDSRKVTSGDLFLAIAFSTTRFAGAQPRL